MSTYWIATTGTQAGDGSQANPWPSLAFALARGGPGQTYIVQPGVYSGNILVPLACAGTAAQPTVLQSSVKYGAVLYGSSWHGLYTDDNCNWIVIDGFEVGGARLDGIKVSGDHGAVRNCWVHQNGGNGIGAHGRVGTTLTRNLVEYNGTHPQYAHGIYADGSGLTLANNIVRHNSAYGVHLYPALALSLIAGNLIYGQAGRHGLLVSCPTGGGQNRITGNTVAGNGAGGIWLQNGNGETLANNIVTETGTAYGAYYADPATVNTVPDSNLCQPAQAAFSGPAGLAADPLYLDPARGAYWLGTGSPALGKANPAYLPAADFWGRTPAPPDLGAFGYDSALLLPAARSTWYQSYPYSFSPLVAGEGLPDLWAPPS